MAVGVDDILPVDNIRYKTSSTIVIAIHQFRRTITAKLFLRCDNLFAGKPADRDFYSAMVLFSERVGVADALVRYTFDGGDVTARTLDFADHGRAISLSTIPDYDVFIAPLKTSAKLRMQLDLPWAGTPVIEFDGAERALQAIPCNDPRR